MRKSLKNSVPTGFKQRSKKGYTLPKLRFGELGLKFNKNYTCERLHFIVLKKKFKFFLKKKRKSQKV